MRPRLRLLSDALIEQILDEALGLLETRGVEINHDVLLGRFADLGCRVDIGRRRVCFGRDLIERCLATAPPQVRLWNIAGDRFCDLSGENVHFTPGSAAIKILDYQTDRMRPATTADMLEYCRLVEQLDAIDLSSTAVVAGDVPEHIGDSVRLYALLKTTSKPIITGAFSIEGFEVMRELQLAVRSSRKALKEKPFAVFSCCPSSPLKWSKATADNAVKCAELDVPVELVSMPLSGLVAPVSLVGCLIQHTAETLSGIAIVQTAAPGAPVLYGGSPGTFDMRSLAATICSVEAQMLSCAYAEIGKHLHLPTQAYMGLSDSKRLDAQAGAESAAGAYLAALAGINSVAGPGMLYFESCQSLEKLVFDAECCAMARRLAAGIEPREDFPCHRLFDQLLAEGSLLTADHTLKHFREEHYVPGLVIDRTQIAADDAGRPGLRQRAHEQVQRLLAEYRRPQALSDEQARRLKEVMQAAAGTFPIDF